MNYKSQLKGWAVDRVIEAKKAGYYLQITSPTQMTDETTLEDLLKAADELSAYAYVPREDLESTAKELFELVRSAPANESMVSALISTLDRIRLDRLNDGTDKAEDAKETAQ